MSNKIDWSLNKSALRKQLLSLTKPKLIKLCKSKKISANGTKGEMINRLLDNHYIVNTPSTSISTGGTNKQTKSNLSESPMYIINKRPIDDNSDDEHNKTQEINQPRLSIFNNHRIDHKCNSKTVDLDQNLSCEAITRIMEALIYYQNLTKSPLARSTSNANAYEIFSQFLLEQYSHYLDDIIHLHTSHSNHLEYLHDLLVNKPEYIACDVNKCPSTDRHCGLQSESTDDINSDTQQSLHIQIWDTTHYYLAHLFELGLRQRERDFDHEEEIEPEIDINDKWKCRDVRFKNQRKQIDTARNKMSRFFDRFDDTSNKFLVSTLQKSGTESDTVIDHIIAYLGKIDEILITQLNKFVQFIKDEGFDTDSIYDDVSQISSSNIINECCTDSSSSIFAASLCDYARQNQCSVIFSLRHNSLTQPSITLQTVSSMSFSTGYSFFYWPYFDAPHRDGRNCVLDEFDGHLSSDLYISTPKYKNLKEEILSNPNEVNMKLFNQQVIFKSEQYFNTLKVRNMKWDGEFWSLFFDIKQNTPITIHQLQAIILYTYLHRFQLRFVKSKDSVINSIMRQFIAD